MILGASFVTSQARHLNLDPQETLKQIVQWPLQTIRLVAKWSECQISETEFHFESLTSEIELCQSLGKEVVLVLGMKGLRWPEFYFPAFVEPDPHNSQTQQCVLLYLQKVLEAVSHFQCIKYWQVENEALNPSGPDKQKIPFEFLKQEVELVQRLDARPVICTAWGNDLPQSRALTKLAPISTITGIDLYYQQYLAGPLGLVVYVGPRGEAQLSDLIMATEKPTWVSELQAEPWEKDEAAYRSDSPKSCSPELLQKWLLKTSELPVQQIHFWGVEYWIWRAQQGDNRYITWAENGFPLGT